MMILRVQEHSSLLHPGDVSVSNANISVTRTLWARQSDDKLQTLS